MWGGKKYSAVVKGFWICSDQNLIQNHPCNKFKVVLAVFICVAFSRCKGVSSGKSLKESPVLEFNV